VIKSVGKAVQCRAEREREAASWASSVLSLHAVTLQPVAGDASFRRYYRLQANGQSLILMDAPPDREDSQPFVDIAGRLRAAGLHAPTVYHCSLERGFALLEDFGDTLYRDILDETTIDDLLPDLFAVLEGMALRVDKSGLPLYDESLLQTEMDLFTEWYLQRHRGRTLGPSAHTVWSKLCQCLLESARQQPQVFVHKDFHSCNLLQTPNGPGIIDFQDGLCGPVTYDLVSLLWDRYITWPRDRLEGWMEAARLRLAPDIPADQWQRYCDLMSLQRNLKIVGIFARLKHRDGKDGYVEMIPRFYGYLLDVLARFPEFSDQRKLLEGDACAP